MKKLMVLFGLVLIVGLMEGKHIHPRSLVRTGGMEAEDSNDSENLADIDGMSIDAIRKFRPNRFVPINSIFAFKTYPPCEDGFERDLLGICREVWD